MKKYEYKTIGIKPGGTFSASVLKETELEKKFNALGQEGWELVTQVEELKNGWTKKVLLVFKREVG